MQIWSHATIFVPLGLVVSNELTNTNVLIMDVFTLLFQVISLSLWKDSLQHIQVNKMTLLEELHIRSLKVWNIVKITFEGERTYCSIVVSGAEFAHGHPATWFPAQPQEG